MVAFAVALVVSKVAAAIALRDAWQLAPNVFDALILSLLNFAAPWPRGERVARALGTVLGAFTVANLGLLIAVGSPLTRSMVAYGVDALAVVPIVPLACTIAALVIFAVVSFALRRVRPERSRAIAHLGALAVVAAILALVRGSWGARDNPVSAFALSLAPAAAVAHGDGAPVAYETPLAGESPPPPLLRRPDARHGGAKHVVIWLAESVGARHADKAAHNLARLRAEGSVSFTSWHANSPVSAKAIFTTLCGLYPLPEAAFESRTIARIACPSLMETMRDAGKRTALFHGGYFAFTDKLALLEERGFEVLMDGESVPDRDRWFTNGWGVDDAALVEHGLGWLDSTLSAASAGTLAVYIPLVPHYEYWLPPGAPTPFGNGTLKARYLNGVAYTDALFAKLVEGYRARGLMNDTLFVFVGDHGEAFEEHAKNRLHAAMLYEENTHVPAVFVAPGLFAGAQESPRIASHVDLVPTVLDLAGVAPRHGLQGQSLVASTWQPRPVMLSTFYPDTLFGARTSRWKYILRTASTASAASDELYDLFADEAERKNVAARHGDVVAALRGRALDYVARQGALLRQWPSLGKAFIERATIEGPYEMVRDKSFNMERRCLRVRPPAALTVKVDEQTPVRLVGVGLTDRARFAKGAPVRARFITSSETVALEVNDVFETTSKVRSLATPASEVRVELDAAAGRDRSVCLTLAP